MLKSIGAVVFSMIVAIVVIFLFELCSHAIFPFPQGKDSNDSQAIAEWIKTLPPLAMWLVILSWFMGSFSGSLVLARIDPINFMRGVMSLGFLLIVSTLLNLTTIPHPLWMWPAGILAILIGLWSGRALLNKLSGS